MSNLDAILKQLPAPSEKQGDLCVVDLSDLLGVPDAQFQYRAPSIYDLYAATDAKAQREWQARYPEIPANLAVLLELIARLHLSPSAGDTPIGEFYATLLQRVPLAVAVQVLQRVESALQSAFGLENWGARVSEKKERTAPRSRSKLST
jgi:hypothetical protein